MSETIDDLDKLTIEAKARARRRRQHRIEQDSLESAIPRGVTLCPHCGAAMRYYVAQYGCVGCGQGADRVTTKRG